MREHTVESALAEPPRSLAAHVVDRLHGHALSTGPPAASRLSRTHTDARPWLALWSLLAGCVLGLVGREIASSAEIARPALVGLAFLAGTLSTWSPCGYSSLSLLRPQLRVPHARSKWAAAFFMHGFGYLAGALVCGTVLGLVGSALAGAGYGRLDLLLLGTVSVGYGLHQLGMIRMPYPERCAQVPHGARLPMPLWRVAWLYGVILGCNYRTYVRSAILYTVVLASIVSGSLSEAVLLFGVLNLGRWLPLLVNVLPVSDVQVQGWLIRHDATARLVDGAVLACAGMAFMLQVLP